MFTFEFGAIHVSRSESARMNLVEHKFGADKKYEPGIHIRITRAFKQAPTKTVIWERSPINGKIGSCNSDFLLRNPGLNFICCKVEINTTSTHHAC